MTIHRDAGPRPATPPEVKYRGPTTQELLDQETVPIPWVLRQEEFTNLGDDPISPERYTSPEFFEREVQKLWPKVWQLACLEQDIPGVGDSIVYDIVDWSFLLVRTAPDEIKAYYNSCLHRGRQLRVNDSCAARVPEFRCPFHGIAWNLDGTLKQIPTSFAWDMSHVDTDTFCLPQVLVDTWDGFVFINMDPAAGPLKEFIGGLADHFERWPFANRWKAAHVAKIMPANWKVTSEAFLESFHVIATHPQMFSGLLGGDGSSCEYDIYGGGDANFNRMILNGPMPNPNLPYQVTEQELIDEMFFQGGVQTERGDTAAGADSPAASVSTAREAMAAMGGRGSSANLSLQGGPQTLVEQTSSIQYFLFPNMFPWAGSIFYRFRPYGRRHDKTIMECMLLVNHPADQPRPPSASIHWLTEEQDWTEATELGALAEIFNQDSGNIPYVQKGLAAAAGNLTLTTYGDSRIRHFHHLLDRYLAAP